MPWQRAFDGHSETTAVVPTTCLLRFDRNHRVSDGAVGRPVRVRACVGRTVLLRAAVMVGAHARLSGRDHTVHEAWLYGPVLGRQPGAPRGSAPFEPMTPPPAIARLRLASVKAGDRQLVDLLVAVDRQDVEAVEEACADPSCTKA